MDIITMNRKDFSVEVKIIKSEKEKTFDIPMLCDNLIWHQILMAKGIDQRVVLTASNTTLAN